MQLYGVCLSVRHVQFRRIPERNGHTDRQTDKQNCYRPKSVCWRAINNRSNVRAVRPFDVNFFQNNKTARALSRLRWNLARYSMSRLTKTLGNRILNYFGPYAAREKWHTPDRGVYFDRISWGSANSLGTTLTTTIQHNIVGFNVPLDTL